MTVKSLKLVVLLFFVLIGNLYANSKPTVAVLDFESIGSEEHLGKAVSEIMRTELIGADQFRVVERAQINKALSEQQLQRSGIIDDKSAIEIGKLIGADLIIVGSVVKIGASYTINSRMIDVKTGEAKLGRNVSGNDLNLLTSLSRELIESLFGMQKKKVPSKYGGERSEEDKTLIPDSSKKSIYGARPAAPSGAVNWGNGKLYFFRGDRYIRFDIGAGRADAGYPKPINSGTWPGMVWIDGIDAAVNLGYGKAYFFRGNQYMRYDIASDRVDPGYPKPINSGTWPGMIWTGGIDAAVNWGNGKAYFFKGKHYIRYDIQADRADPGYPKPINAQTWPGMIWTDGIDDVFIGGKGKAFFFKGDQFIRYDMAADRADPGYPRKIDHQTWPGLLW
jgi:matrix metalloproteinase-14 (membrane-inserted)